MNPCYNRRKAIAMLAMNEVPGREMDELRSHLQSCEGCRGYLEEISAVTKKLAAVETAYDVETSEAFHREMMSRLRGRKSISWEIARIFGLNWRIAFPTAAVLILIIAFCSQLRVSNVAPKPIAPRTTQLVAARDANPDIPPTLGNYQMAANQSLQKFDALLNREAKNAVQGGPVYTVSELTMADAGQ